MSNFDVQHADIVGHNIIGFDLPFIFQGCLAHKIAVVTHGRISVIVP